jgi:hypothetical protein
MKRESGAKENTIAEWDVCMLYINKFPTTFVRINFIWEDEKPGWWNVNLTRLGLPVESFTWKLDDNHLACEEFTMNDIPMMFQILPRPDLAADEKKDKKKVKEGNTVPDKKVDLNNVVEDLFKPRPKVVSLFNKITESPPPDDNNAA